MSIKLNHRCQPAEGVGASPSSCHAAFRVDGQAGSQKLLAGGIVQLKAEYLTAVSYQWEVLSSPPACDFLLSGATQSQARLSLPGPGTYTVQLTVKDGDCTAQKRAILWVASPCRLYRLPAVHEALRFDGHAEWAGDLAKVLLDVDCNLPTPQEKSAMANAHGPGADNPFATLNDLLTLPDGDSGNFPSAPQLTPQQEAAIDAADNPDEDNPFITKSALPATQLTRNQLAAFQGADKPSARNAFITASALPPPQLNAAEEAAVHAAKRPSQQNRFVTLEELNTTNQRGTLVAAANLSLTGDPHPGQTIGNLRVVNHDVRLGLATLTFDGYGQDLAEQYIVKAQSPEGKPALGSCMLEVTRLL